MTKVKSLVFSALLMLSATFCAAQTAVLLPEPKIQFLGATGVPLSGGCVQTYAAGTTTPQATFTDSTGGVSNTNPVILDSAGRASIFLSQGVQYKFVVTSFGGSNCATGTLQYTQDNVALGSTLTVGGANTQVQYNSAGALAGSANFTWNNATQTLTIGALVTTSGGTLNGSFAGNPNFTGNPTFTNFVTFTGGTNAGLKYATSDAYIYVSGAGSDSNDGLSPGTAKLTVAAAITAVKAQGGGTVDARTLYTATFTSQIGLGDHTGTPRVVLLTPPTGIWTFNITDGTSCGILVYNLSALIGSAAGVGSSFSLQPFNGSTNMDSLVCTDSAPVGGGSYVRIEHLAANYNGQTGARFSHGLVNLQNLFDGSLVDDMVIQTSQSAGTTPYYGLLVQGACCGTTINNVVVNGNHTANVIPCAVIDPAGFGSANVAALSWSCGHPGTGKPQLSINQSAALFQNTGAWNFYNLQGESNSSDTVTALVQIVSANAKFFGGRLFHLTGGDTAYCFDISGVNAQADIRGFECKSAGTVDQNAINNHISSQTVLTDTVGNVPDYVVQLGYRNGLIVNQVGAGGMPNNAAGNSGVCNIGNTQNVIGTADLNIQCSPSAVTGYTWLEDLGSIGLGLGTFGTHPVDIAPNRTKSARFLSGGGIQALGTAAVLTGTGACATLSTQTGGAWAGRATCTAATAASTLTITPGSTATNGWVCSVFDQTTRANLLQQTSNTTTSCTLTATSVTQNDVIVFSAIAF